MPVKAYVVKRQADVFHCEPMEKVADDFIQRNHIANGNYDNLAECKYTIPDYWDIGEVFARLIEDCYEESNIISGTKEVYQSWLIIQDKKYGHMTVFFLTGENF